MSMSREDLNEIEQHFDDRYVLQVRCSEKQLKFNERLAMDDKRIEIMYHDFGVVKKLMWAVATASIGTLVVAFFELILK